MQKFSILTLLMISSASAQSIQPMRDPVPTRNERALSNELGCSDSCRWSGTRADGKQVADMFYREAVNHCNKHFADTFRVCNDTKKLREGWITKRRSDSIGFPNPPGSFGAGSCWAWSTERKNSLFLSRFRPEDPPMRNSRAIRMNFKLLSMGYIVEFPGVKSVYELSTHPSYRSEWISVIERLQTSRATGQGNISRATSRVSTVPEALKQNLEQIKLLQSELALGRQPILLIDFGFGLFEQHIVSVVSLNTAPKKGWEIATIDPNFPGSTKPLEIRQDGTLGPYGWYRLAPFASIKFIPDAEDKVIDQALVAECCFQETQKSARQPSALAIEPFMGQGLKTKEDDSVMEGTLASALRELQSAKDVKASQLWARILKETSHLPIGAERQFVAHLKKHPDPKLQAEFCNQRGAQVTEDTTKLCQP